MCLAAGFLAVFVSGVALTAAQSVMVSQVVACGAQTGCTQQLVGSMYVQDTGPQWTVRFTVDTAPSAPYTTVGPIEVTVQKSAGRVEYPLQYLGVVHNAFETIKRGVYPSACPGPPSRCCPTANGLQDLHSWTQDPIHNASYNVYAIAPGAVRYTLDVTVTQNGAPTAVLAFNEAGGTLQWPAASPSPAVVANILTASVPSSAYCSFGSVYLLLDPTLDPTTDAGQGFLVPQSAFGPGAREIGITSATFSQSFQCGEPPGFLFGIPTLSDPHPDPYDQFAAFRTTTMVQCYGAAGCTRYGAYCSVSSTAGGVEAFQCPSSGVAFVSLTLAASTFQLTVRYGVPVVASAGVIPVAAGAALLPFAVAITNAADCPATFTLQLTLLCYTDGMDPQGQPAAAPSCLSAAAVSGTAPQFYPYAPGETHTFAFSPPANLFVGRRGYCNVTVAQGSQFDGTVSVPFTTAATNACVGPSCAPAASPSPPSGGSTPGTGAGGGGGGGGGGLGGMVPITNLNWYFFGNTGTLNCSHGTAVNGTCECDPGWSTALNQDPTQPTYQYCNSQAAHVNSTQLSPDDPSVRPPLFWVIVLVPPFILLLCCGGVCCCARKRLRRCCLCLFWCCRCGCCPPYPPEKSDGTETTDSAASEKPCGGLPPHTFEGTQPRDTSVYLVKELSLDAVEIVV